MANLQVLLCDGTWTAVSPHVSIIPTSGMWKYHQFKNIRYPKFYGLPICHTKSALPVSKCTHYARVEDDGEDSSATHTLAWTMSQIHSYGLAIFEDLNETYTDNTPIYFEFGSLDGRTVQYIY